MAEQIRRDLAEIIRDDLKDPRMGFLSLTEVRLSRDLSQCIVFCSILEQDKQQESMDTLNRAAGFLRTQVAKRMRSRTVPNIKFILDTSLEKGAAMDALIQKAISGDGDVAGDSDNEKDET